MTPRHNNRPVTLATIAEAVGVSRMTVSNAYNRPDQLSPALREKILAAAQELGYGGPDPVARTLKSRCRPARSASCSTTRSRRRSPTPRPYSSCRAWPPAARSTRAAWRSCRASTAATPTSSASALVDGFVLYCVPPGDPRFEAVRARRAALTSASTSRPTPDLTQRQHRRRGRRTRDRRPPRRARPSRLRHRPDAPRSSGATAAEAEARAVYHVEIARLAGWRAGLEAGGIDWDASRSPAARHGRLHAPARPRRAADRDHRALRRPRARA